MNTFAQDTTAALVNPQLRRNFDKAMTGLMQKRVNAFAEEETEALRELGYQLRMQALQQLPELLEQLEAKCTANGIHVHWAATVEEGNRKVLEIAQRHNAKTIVKGKSMVSEEMELNHFMEPYGIECLESDLGEYIIQIDHETPSHIIMPAIHKNTQEIATLFDQKLHVPYTEDAADLTAAAREILRQKFHDAEVGISGVNFAVAETGTLCLVENEGNGRFSTTVPPVHVAIMGLEKVVAQLADVPPLLSLLTRSATGQPITTYFNMITSPRKADELDGPTEVHLLLLDNGRSTMYADELLRETLLCIRCGACMNHCPVYARIGGHAYSSVYPGPIGKILTPQIKGLDDAGHLAGASSLCGACVEVCPVKIPITDILLKLRQQQQSHHLAKPLTDPQKQKTLFEKAVWKVWALGFAHPKLYRVMSWKLSRLARHLPYGKFPGIRRWTAARSEPKLAPQTLHERVKALGVEEA